MTSDHIRHSVFPPADRDVAAVERLPSTPQTENAAYRLAFRDVDFLMRDELRPVRLQLELLKVEMAMNEREIDSTVVLFGGARIRPPGLAPADRPGMAALSHFYEEARRFAKLASEESLRRGGREFVIVTGGGPGVMEAGNRGAHEAGAQSIGLNIMLPHEQAPNGWVTPDLSFNFHYFAIRKMHFLMRAAAVAVFPGGFGTLDELFETLTLIQTRRMAPMPVVLFGEAFWRKVVNFEALIEAGTIAPEDLNLFHFCETAEDAWAYVSRLCGVGESAGRSAAAG
ncbi:MAG: LOG family protein [Rhodobacteraceae bacterium]|nr:MAG: LOG family protein [Paracoccaceae bacterium]